MEEIEKLDNDSKNEKIIDQDEEIFSGLDIKYKNISNETLFENDEYKCFGFHKNFKNKLKVIFCPCYCLFYKSFEWIWDGRCEYEAYYKSHYFIENIFFCIISIIDIVSVSFYKDNFNMAFFVIRIISDSLGIFILWLIIVLWDKNSSNEFNFLLLNFIDIILIGLLDIFSFVIFCASNSEFIIIVLMSFLIHFISSTSIFSFNLCKYFH